jgi:hypothetical protein
MTLLGRMEDLVSDREPDLNQAAALLGALAVPSRLELVNAIVQRQHRDQECSMRTLAAAVDRTQKEVVKDAVRLQECGLVSLDRTNLSVDLSLLQAAAKAIDSTFPISALLRSEPDLQRFFRHGRLIDMPENPVLKGKIAGLLARLLPVGHVMSEAVVNGLLGQVHPDVASLRRLLVDLGLVTRDGSSDYRRLSDD